MDFIQQSLNNRQGFWRYLVGSLIVIIAALIGQIPFTVVAIKEAVNQGLNILDGIDEKTMLGLLESNYSLFLMLISFVVALFGLFIILKPLHKHTIKIITTAREKVDWKRILFAFFFWGIISSGLTLLDYYTNPDGYVMNFNAEKFAILAVIAVILVPIQTSAEEFIFRGYLMQGFGKLARNRWFPLIMTSVIFGGLHVFNPEVETLGYSIMVYYIGTGLFLGIITLMDDGIELALGFHAANNLFTALLVTADWTVFQTHSILKDISEPSLGFMDLIVPVFIIFPILIVIFGKIYGWKNWKGKLFGEIHDLPTDDYKIIGESDTNI